MAAPGAGRGSSGAGKAGPGRAEALTAGRPGPGRGSSGGGRSVPVADSVTRVSARLETKALLYASENHAE